MAEKTEILTGEIVTTENNVIGQLERASIDMQVATAKQYPRDLARFQKNAIAIATIDEDTAASCLYNRPVGKDRFGKDTFAEGMSIRMAEIVAACYGNIRVGTRILESTPRYVLVQGVAHDLESNFLSTAECKEATIKKNGQPYDERMRVVIEKAAAAKAYRDAVFKVVPRAAAKAIENAVKKKLFNNSETLEKFKKSIPAWVKTLGINAGRVWAAIEISSAEELTMESVQTLIGIKTAIQNGDITIDDAFPELEKSKMDQAMESAKVEHVQPADKKDELI